MSARSPFPLALPRVLVERSVAAALAEDLGAAGDITTDAIVPADAAGKAAIVARQAGVVAGLDLAEAAFKALDPEISFTRIVEDGGSVAAGGKIATVAGKARAIRFSTLESICTALDCQPGDILTFDHKGNQ